MIIPPTVIFVVVLCVDFNTVVEYCHKVLSSGSATGSAKANETDSPINGTVNVQANETTPLNQRFDMEDNEDEL